MARQKKQNTDEQKELNKELSLFVFWLYTELYGVRPDVTAYQLAQRVVKPLLEAQDSNMRVYTVAHLEALVRRLTALGVVVDFYILTKTDLLRSFVDEDTAKFSSLVDRLLKRQMLDGVYTKKQIENMKPIGW